MSFINEPMGKYVDLIHANRIPHNRWLLIRTLRRFKDHYAPSNEQTVEAFFAWYARRFEKEFNEEVRPNLEYLMNNMCIYLHFSLKENQTTYHGSTTS